MKLRVLDFELPLRHVFAISRETMHVQPTVIVELSDGVHRGYGEATANRYYGESVESIREAIERQRRRLESLETFHPESLWQELAGSLADHPFAQCALDQAAWDLWGKQQGAPLYQLWGLNTDFLPPSNFTIGIDSIEVMIAKLREVPGWPVYKIKLGTDHDLEIIRQLRGVTDAPFRVDANCGWGVEETIRNSHELLPLGVEFIEQPLPAEDHEGSERVFQRSVLPVIADESCIVEADVDRCHRHFHGINIKLVKCGGLTPARRMIARARQLGLKVMVGCMTESTVGISAIAQLLPLLDYVDMDGAALLARDIGSGVVVEQGRCRYATENGTGVRLLPDT